MVMALLLLFGEAVPGRWVLFALHAAAFLVIPAACTRLGGNSVTARSVITRGVAACIFLPLVFTETGLLLPWVNPEPLEWYALALDRMIFSGRDAEAVFSFLRAGFLPDILMACYSTFYFLPLLLGVFLLRGGKVAEAHEFLVAVTFGFCLSYLLYIATPVLAPPLTIDFKEPIRGGAFFRFLHHALGSLELNKRDCFPSGHTWITLTVLHYAFLHGRRTLVFLLPVGLLLIFATFVLRFHFFVDVVAGAVLYYPSIRLSRLLVRPETGGP